MDGYIVLIVIVVIVGVAVIIGVIAWGVKKWKEIDKHFDEVKQKQLEEEEAEKRKIAAMSPSEREAYLKEKEELKRQEAIETERSINEAVAKQCRLPEICPQCNNRNIGESVWKRVDSSTSQSFRSAYSAGGYTTINVDEKETIRFICPHCKFIIYGTR